MQSRFYVRRLIGLIGLGVISASVFAAGRVAVQDVRMSAAGETMRIVFDLSQSTSQQVFTLHSPERVVIDLDDARLDLPNGAWPSALGVVKQFRSAERGNGVLRVVLEVEAPVESRSFTLPASEGAGHRLVIDVAPVGKLAAMPAVTPSTAPAPVLTNVVASSPAAMAEIAPPAKALPKKDEEGRHLVIAIDAGHGGQDPGASGRRGTREKDVTLAIARRLKQAIDSEPGMRAVLTRDGDYFVPLRERIVRARRMQADLFVSIHADSVRDRDVSGASVYVLSAGRASNEAARMLADRENAADLMGGMTLENKNDVVASVLLDLSQGASMSASIEAAENVLRQLNRVGAVLDNQVKHASLKVLTSPDMPSMLVETGFISNPREEAKLNDARHQQRLADAILAGVRGYFYDNPPPGTRIAQRVAQLRAEKQDRSAAGVTRVMAGGIAQ